MTRLDYAIAPEVFAAHPGYRRGLVVVRDARNDGDGALLEALLRDEEAGVRERLAATANVAEHPVIAAWRDAFRRFGAKPSEHRSAIEAIVRRVIKPDRMPSINPLVDIGTIVSLRHLLPAGVHPLPALPASLALRPAADGDRFAPADGSPDETPAPGEIVFARDAQVLTRRWTWRQAAGTQTLPTTRAVFVNLDGLPPTDDATLRAAMRDVEALVREHVGGAIAASVVLDAGHPCAQITLD